MAVNHRPSEENARIAAEQVSGYTVRGIAVPADVSQRAQLEQAVRETVAAFGRLDIVVSNAAIMVEAPFLQIKDEDWERVLAVNLNGPFYLAQIAARQMVAQGGGGKILNISSVHEDIPFVGHTPYCAAKGALRMMMRNLALELAAHRINVNNIAPGAIATPMNQAVLEDPTAKKNALSEIPWGRFGKPEEIASLAVFLASDESDYITGSTYLIDGGLEQQVTKY